ncbi:hypothetical protein [uncultured Dechloromonas sp.]|uniref:hypothetical protein n=1 Tax=uncultured Dechloromonas sp. TaxID=171719 RepID=UPI0025E8A44E|nr:hypothetical protein [uncultured Dechloromonas sp.]
MIPLTYPSNLLSAHAQRPGSLLREVAARQDRVPQDQRVDLPEIQESFRVSFSDEARAYESSGLGNEQYRQAPAGTPPENARKLRAYDTIAGL